jgi:HAD superfamily hydrolase (TIGR01509 family)
MTVPIRAVVLDFDGLMVDTEVPEFQSWQEIYAAHDAVLPLSTWARCIGSADHGFDPYAHLEATCGRAVDRSAIRARRRARMRALLEGQTLLPGVEQLVADARIHGVKVGLASSSTRAWVENHLRRIGFRPHLDAIRTRDDVHATKPDPELYLAAVAALGVSPAEAIAFEDSPNGVHAAKAAGLYCVAVANQLTAGLDLRAADLRLPSLDALPLADILRRATVRP